MLQRKDVRNDVVIEHQKWREHHFGFFFENKKLTTLNIYGGLILSIIDFIEIIIRSRGY